jgi:hypothetical protein
VGQLTLLALVIGKLEVLSAGGRDAFEEHLIGWHIGAVEQGPGLSRLRILLAQGLHMLKLPLRPGHVDSHGSTLSSQRVR